MESKIDEVFEILKIEPKNKEIYKIALTHKTFTNENKKHQSYERLEFLGDSILQFYSSLIIYNNFPNEDEGKMSFIRAKNTSTQAFARIVKNHKINKFIICSNNIEELQENEKICSDIFESLVAAIYLDLGYDELSKFLDRFLLNSIKSTSTLESKLKDPKTLLQELLQPMHKMAIYYESNLKNNIWNTKVICNGNIYGIGSGKTKKEAEINAAKDALKKRK